MITFGAFYLIIGTWAVCMIVCATLIFVDDTPENAYAWGCLPSFLIFIVFFIMCCVNLSNTKQDVRPVVVEKIEALQ